MATVHWLGAGLSSIPGIRRLASSGVDMVLWNRTLDRATEALAGVASKASAAQLDWQALSVAIEPGDVVISMLPGTLHIKVATLCLERKAHFVSSSYISPEMASFHTVAEKAGLCFVNEVGLDPGVDHLLAHSLVDEYKNSSSYDPNNSHYFRSFCGGFPKVANDFTYKFSWSPLGVLKALTSVARWKNAGEVQSIGTPWKAVTAYTAKIAGNSEETFEAYPNRDSLPFMAQYGFAEDWDTQEFVRGTLRLSGWTKAWQYLFDEIESLTPANAEQRLTSISDDLWDKYAYHPGEQDRVVLCVELEVRDANQKQVIWHKSYDVDETGKDSGSAMGRLVSITVSLAVESVLNGELVKGVSAAPDKPAIVNDWLDKLRAMGEIIPQNDRLT